MLSIWAYDCNALACDLDEVGAGLFSAGQEACSASWGNNEVEESLLRRVPHWPEVTRSRGYLGGVLVSRVRDVTCGLRVCMVIGLRHFLRST